MTQRVLVTNDDGIDGPGLRVLVTALVNHGYEPFIVAPDQDYSGAGTSIISQTGTDFAADTRQIKYEKRVLPEAPEAQAFAVAAPPAMCTLLAMREAFGPAPSMIASGINYGLNVGGAVRHSGTVSAAITGAAFGVPAIAVSAEFNFAEPDKPLRYDTAAEVAMQLLALMPGSGHQVLNINVPQCGLDELAGIAASSVSQVARFRSVVESHEDGMLHMGYQMTDDEVEPGSDTAHVLAGYAAVSSLLGPTAIDSTDIVSRLGQATS